MLHTLGSILTFIAIFAVLVFFHELGHFLLAKLFGMRVEEFALGMGVPKLRLFTDGETEYTLRAIPIGGFVRIAGMEIEDAYEQKISGADRRYSDADSELDNTNTGTMKQEAAEVAGADPNGFNSRPIYQRFLVILAGPVFSFLLGYLALCLTIGLFGVPNPPTTTIESVIAGTPAASAGLRPGDKILAVGGKPVQQSADIVDLIQGSKGAPVVLHVARASGKGDADITVTPRMEVDPTVSEKVPRIGIQFQESRERHHVGFSESLSLGGRSVATFFILIGKIFASGHAKDAVGGPIAIAKQVAIAQNQGIDVSLDLLAQLSLSLGLFNLFPIPILDGGHLALLTLEAIRRRKLTAEQTQRVFAAGLALLGLLFVYVMVKDIFHLFQSG